MTVNESSPDSEQTLVLTERIGAPPDAVFQFLVDPDKFVRWMGTSIDINPKPGGSFWLNVNGTDIASGTYLDLQPPDRVVFTWGWEGSADVPPGSSTVTINLQADGDHTIVELRHDGLPGGAGDSHRDGWTHFLPRLADVAVGRDPGPTTFGAS